MKSSIASIGKMLATGITERRVLGKKKEVPVVQVRRVLGKKKQVPLPTGYITPAMEAFELIREYSRNMGKEVSAEDIAWYYDELTREKKEYDEFWERCAVTKAYMEGILRGDDDWTIQLAENAARQKVKALPIQEADIGPMPGYGTKEFWAWCHKRKMLRQQKDAAILAAGGKVKNSKKVKG